MRIILLGYIVRGPVAGLVWHHAQYALALHRMGHDVWFLEDSEDWPCCFDPVRNVTDADPTYGLHFMGQLMAQLGMKERWAYYDAHTNQWHGPAGAKAVELCQTADVVLNLAGVNPLREWTAGVPIRALIDVDPVFAQVRCLTDPWYKGRCDQHNRHFTFALNIGQANCTIPDSGVNWRPTRQPMCLDLWPVTPPPEDGAFSTVMQWDSYSKREYLGRTYGMKSMSFGPYENLPAALPGVALELAMTGDSAAECLRGLGWRTRDPLALTRDPWVYQGYLQQSLGEWSIAKHGYVTTRSGWFSERTCCYLACGRPAVVQETGFSDWLPTGAGLMAFSTPEQARACIGEVLADYPRHCRAARAVVEEHFDSRRVLHALLNAL